ncbi:MAG: hypothetical protein IPJ77_06370 [Planctomycetes bacterium]|nr:hypothetical protein [Planctomycetota bacterium]
MHSPSRLARFAALTLALASIDLLASFHAPSRARERTPRNSPASRLTSGGGNSVTPAIARRLLYVWDNTLPGDTTRTGQLFDFCRRNGVATIALDCAPLGSTPGAHAARYRSFIESAHGRDLRVLALAGDSWWTVPANAGLPNQAGSQLTGWTFYAAVRASNAGFDGVLDVSEPYQRDPAAFWNEPAAAAQGLVDFLRGMRGAIGNLPLYHAMPYWYDEDPRLVLRLGGSRIARPLNQYVQPLVDVTVLMENRDQALGADGILAHSQGELATGPCILGVETQDLGASGDALTFWEEGRIAMERELALVVLARLNQPNLRGFAIHHYASFANLHP